MLTVALVADPSVISPTLLSTAAGVLQTQVLRDLSPSPPNGWGKSAAVIACSIGGNPPPPGSLLVRITANVDDPNEIGYHKIGITPTATVQLESTDEDWIFYASHELLEMLVDPQGDVLPFTAPSIDPATPGAPVRYLPEICDPVQDPSQAYLINGYHVSNFVLPTFYEPARGLPFDHCNNLRAPLQPAPGGCIAWADPASNSWMHYNYGDDAATNGTPLSQPPPGMAAAEYARTSPREIVHRAFGRHEPHPLSAEQLADARDRRESLVRGIEPELRKLLGMKGDSRQSRIP